MLRYATNSCQKQTLVVFRFSSKTSKIAVEFYSARHVVNQGEFLTSEIGSFSGLGPRRLAFNRELEARFETSTGAFRRKRIQLEGLGAVALYSLFCLLKCARLEEQSRTGVLVRLCVVVPLALLANASMSLEIPAWMQETGILFVACLAGSIELLLSTREPPAVQAYAQIAVIAVLVFTNTLMRLRARYMAVAFVWAVGSEALFLFNSQGLNADEKYFGFLLTIILGVITAMANYSQSREQRLAFLREHHKDTLVGELSRSNQDLAAVAHTDNLTGLANRAGLNAQLETLWSTLCNRGGILSVILVDVDHFKSLNDEFGHLYGDKVLVRVARLLAEALRREDDFIARFGGEEFLILLPDTPPHLALLVAERLRGLVELAGLPALPGHDPRLRGRQATVSCGVASSPALSVAGPLDVLHAADTALYTAKRSGRNRVSSSVAIHDDTKVATPVFAGQEMPAAEVLSQVR